jgi:4a-hydroxytetrahydrobiopterin dehydratase
LPVPVNTQPLKSSLIHNYLQELGQEWSLVEGLKLKKSFHFTSFKTALNFVQAIGALAEEENHHPKMILNYHIVTLEITTHSVKGLTLNDFIFAAKSDAICITLYA